MKLTSFNPLSSGPRWLARTAGTLAAAAAVPAAWANAVGASALSGDADGLDGLSSGIGVLVAWLLGLFF